MLKGKPRRSLPRKGNADSDTTDVEDNVTFEVDSIRGKKIDDDNKIYYLVKWKAWDGDATWEPEENCLCTQKIEDWEKATSYTRKSKKEPSPMAETPRSGKQVRSKIRSQTSNESRPIRMLRNRRPVV